MLRSKILKIKYLVFTNLAGNTEITNLATNTTLSTRINEIKIKIPWSTEFLRPYILLFLKKKQQARSLTRTLSMLFTKDVKIIVILLNMRILNIAHKHLLKENN